MRARRTLFKIILPAAFALALLAVSLGGLRRDKASATQPASLAPNPNATESPAAPGQGQSTSLPAAATSRAPSAGASASDSSEFRELTEQTLRSLPTRAAMRDLTEEEAHGTPEPVAAAGTLLGRVAQAVTDRPSLKPQAAEFYVRCATDAELLTSVRALCYSHVLGEPQAPSEQELPAEVVRLAKLIPRS